MKALPIFALAVGLTMASPLLAQTVSAKDLEPKTIVATMKGKTSGERQSYTAMVIASIASMPVSDEEKTEKLITAARALIAGSKSGNTIGVIAEIFNSLPVQYLPAVAKMLTGNFDQTLNKLDDAKMMLYIEKIVGRAASYIEVSGCDSPAIRAGILAATFIDAANDKDAAKAKVAEVLPESLRAAALAYAEDTMADKLDTIAEGAGVDPEEIAETPAKDPNEKDVVKNPAAKTEEPSLTAEEKAAIQAEREAKDAAEVQAAIEKGEPNAPTATPEEAAKPAKKPVVTPVDNAEIDEGPEMDKDEAEIRAAIDEGDKKPASTDPRDFEPEESPAVPLLSRFSKDVTGLLSDTIDSSLYDWEEIDPTTLTTDPLSASLLGVGNVTVVPGEGTVGGFGLILNEPESPLYDGQR